jgi:hypothetical protein
MNPNYPTYLIHDVMITKLICYLPIQKYLIIGLSIHVILYNGCTFFAFDKWFVSKFLTFSYLFQTRGQREPCHGLANSTKHMLGGC